MVYGENGAIIVMWSIHDRQTDFPFSRFRVGVIAMAKRGAASKPDGGKVNKAAAVREFLSVHPDAKSAEVVTALAAKGIDVAPNYIATVRYHQSNKVKGKKGEVTVPELKLMSRVISRDPGGVSKAREALALAKELAGQFEGLERAEQVLNAYNEFVSGQSEGATTADGVSASTSAA